MVVGRDDMNLTDMLAISGYLPTDCFHTALLLFQENMNGHPPTSSDRRALFESRKLAKPAQHADKRRISRSGRCNNACGLLNESDRWLWTGGVFAAMPTGISQKPTAFRQVASEIPSPAGLPSAVKRREQL